MLDDKCYGEKKKELNLLSLAFAIWTKKFQFSLG